MGFFSDELRILDENTARYMIDRQQKELDQLKQETEQIRQQNDQMKSAILQSLKNGTLTREQVMSILSLTSPSELEELLKAYGLL